VATFLDVELGHLGVHAIQFDDLVLVETACRQQGFFGMQLAHNILDRCLAEKRYLDTNNNNNNNTNDSDNNQTMVHVPLDLFKTILYGWSSIATRGKIAVMRMREIMDRVLEVAQHDHKRLMKPREAKNISDDANDTATTAPLVPNTDLYNTYLMGLRNASRVSRPAAASVIAVLDEMTSLRKKYGWHIKPNTKTYTLVISALANSGLNDAGDRAERVLRRMIQVHGTEKERYLQQYGVPYDTADPANNRRRIPTPDLVVYTSVIRAYSQGHSERVANKAKDLLIEYMSLFSNGTTTQAPDAFLFTSVISAYAAVAENRRISNEARLVAAKEAQEVLEMMLEDFRTAGGVLSTVEPYNGMLISWCYYCITFVAHIIPTPFSPLQPVSMPMPSALLHRPL